MRRISPMRCAPPTFNSDASAGAVDRRLSAGDRRPSEVSAAFRRDADTRALDDHRDEALALGELQELRDDFGLLAHVDLREGNATGNEIAALSGAIRAAGFHVQKDVPAHAVER